MIIQSSTNKGQTMINRYYDAVCSDTRELWQVYDRVSKKKRAAMDTCKELQYQLSGLNGVITSHSSYVFSYAFMFIENDAPYLMYITRDNNYKIPLIDNKTGEIYLDNLLSAAGLI